MTGRSRYTGQCLPEVSTVNSEQSAIWSSRGKETAPFSISGLLFSEWPGSLTFLFCFSDGRWSSESPFSGSKRLVLFISRWYGGSERNFLPAGSWRGLRSCRSQRRRKVDASSDNCRSDLSRLWSVGAGHLADRPAYRLSVGEKRDASIVAVLSMLPDILVMDEPSSGLDPRNRRLLIGLPGDFTHTRLIATHDLVLHVCPRTIILHRGKVAAKGPTPEIFRNEGLLRRCDLEPPVCMQRVRP